MTRNLDQLRAKRLRWVDANRENNFEEGIKRLLTDLYPDNAHFIYELLQNAEDPRASTVRFRLTRESLEFSHDGERLFDLKDVESITSIGVSTKRDDPTNIGKFGVGFKAVFAYTQTPEIHSGSFHLRIRDLVVPESDGIHAPRMGANETRFLFPFDHPTKQRTQAVAEVERALRSLRDNTLLFLSHIRKIEYQLPDGSVGTHERIEHADGQIEIMSRQPGDDTKMSHWLRFQNDVEVTDEGGETRELRIAIAYSLKKKDEGGKQNRAWEIVPLDHGQVSIYFPAEKERSNLRFHLHAPFASTVARDSVRESDANLQLRDHIADLVVTSLGDIRDRGLLTVGFLAVLPNDQDGLPEFYEPLREKVVSAFSDQRLTPTRSGSHAPASSLYVGPAKIAETIDDDDLSLLTNHTPPLWAANPPPQNQREDRFLQSLQIDRFGWEELVEKLSLPHVYAYDASRRRENEEHKDMLESWIHEKEDSWLKRFYALLGESHDEHNKLWDATEFRVIRVVEGLGVDHVTPNEAFFPPDEITESDSQVRFVAPSVYRGGRSKPQSMRAESFLRSIGVREYDQEQSIKLRLEAYREPPSEAGREYYLEIREFIAFWKKYPDQAKLFVFRDFLLADSDKAELVWCRPEELCLDSPYMSTGLAELNAIHELKPLCPSYADKLPKGIHEDFLRFVVSIGVSDRLWVRPCHVWGNPHRKELYADRYGSRATATGINIDYWIEGLEEYLETRSVGVARLIWRALIQADPKAKTARYRPNQQYPIRQAESRLVHHLKSNAWIPDKSGKFRTPQEITAEELPSDFVYDDSNGLLAAIGFGERRRQQSEEYRAKDESAKGLGFANAQQAEEISRLLREGGISPDELRAWSSSRRKVAQPEASVPNPERRRQGVLERSENAPSRESVKRERSILPGANAEMAEAKAYLRAKYKNADAELVCQCCHTEMPFKVNGEHYFEAVQCIRGLKRHLFQNRLALCPTCAAMYLYARSTDDGEVRRLVLETNVAHTASYAEMTVTLAEREFRLRFVGTHWFDLKTILRDG
jgi:hypothetical protein